MTQTLNPNDSGEIARYDSLGDEPTTDLRAHLRRDTTGEATENLGRYLVDNPSFEAIPRRVFDIDDTVTYMPATIGIVDQAPLERVADETEVHTILDSLAGVRAGIDGELAGPQKPPPPLPKPPRPAAPGKQYRYVGRHRLVREEHPGRGLLWLALAAAIAVAIVWWVP